MNHVLLTGRLVADPVLCLGPHGQRYASFELVIYDPDSAAPACLSADGDGRPATPDRVFPCVLWGDAGVQLAYDGRAGQYVEVSGRFELVCDESRREATWYPLIRCRRADIVPAHLAGYFPWERHDSH